MINFIYIIYLFAGSDLIKEVYTFSDKVYVDLKVQKKTSKLNGMQIAVNKRLSSVIFGLPMNSVRIEMHRFYCYTKEFFKSLKMLRYVWL